jgi:adenosylcobinamide-GDP ribazoletransferase
MTQLRPFLIALQFLTRFPVRLNGMPQAREIGQSLLYYPLVGALLGLLLVALDAFLAGVGTLLAAALLLAFWVLASGALHLDGLADSVDAWVGGLGERERTLAIMKDPYCGPMGVAALLLVLLLKFAALEELLANGAGLALLLAPLLGRAALPALFVCTPYVRPGGLGEALARSLPRGAALLLVATVLLGSAALGLAGQGMSGLWPLLAACAAFAALRAAMMQRLGGTTGDTAGALVETVETAVLLAAALA